MADFCVTFKHSSIAIYGENGAACHNVEPTLISDFFVFVFVYRRLC